MYTYFKNTTIEIEDGDRGKNYPSPNEFSKHGYCLFLNNKNIINNKLSLDNAQYISKDKYCLLGKGVIDIGDLVLTTRGTLGNCLLFDNDVNLPARINSGMVIIRPRKDFIPKFLYYYIQSNCFQKQILEMRSGSAQPQLPIKNIQNMLVPLIPISSQQHIVDTIGSIDDLIDLNNKIISNLISLLNNKLNILISKSNEYIPLNKIINERKERIGINNVKLLSVVNTGELVLQDEYFDKNTASADMKKYKLIRKFNYAYNPARINIGSIGMLKEDYLGAISPIYIVFEINEHYKYYLDFYKNSNYMKKFIEKKSSGSVRQNLPFSEFSSIEIPNINIDSLIDFNKLCEMYYTKINELKRKNAILILLKQQYLKKFFG